MSETGAREKFKEAPKKRKRHYSYDESVDEPSRVLEDEAVEIEQEIPSEDVEPIENIEPDDTDAPVFEE